MSISRGEKDALQGAALSGVDEYGVAIECTECTEWVECAEPMAGENGDCGMWSLRGVRPDADLGGGLAKGEGGMITRGESDRVLEVPVEMVCEVALFSDALVVADVVESYELLRDNVGSEAG